MKHLTIIILLMSSIIMSAQNESMTKTIEVTGEYTKEVEPNTVIYSINLQEYWLEEFEEDTEWKDYKTKRPIAEIEEELMEKLEALGIKKSQITLQNTGNYWRSRGKDLLITKQLEIKLKDFEKANELSNGLEMRGLQSMHVARLEHDKMEKLTLEAKKKALERAEEMAEEMAEVFDQEIVDVISIREHSPHAQPYPRPMMYGAARSMASETASAGVDYDNYRDLKIHAKMHVVFQIAKK